MFYDLHTSLVKRLSLDIGILKSSHLLLKNSGAAHIPW